MNFAPFIFLLPSSSMFVARMSWQNEKTINHLWHLWQDRSKQALRRSPRRGLALFIIKIDKISRKLPGPVMKLICFPKRCPSNFPHFPHIYMYLSIYLSIHLLVATLSRNLSCGFFCFWGNMLAFWRLPLL